MPARPHWQDWVTTSAGSMNGDAQGVEARGEALQDAQRSLSDRQFPDLDRPERPDELGIGLGRARTRPIRVDPVAPSILALRFLALRFLALGFLPLRFLALGLLPLRFLAL
jgi:hypothetical protein